MHVHRRGFLALSSAFASEFAFATAPGLNLAAAAPSSISVGTVIDRIKLHVGVPWREKTVDHLLTGTLDLPVQGIATTMMATFAVCKRAQALNLNFILSHETPFYLHQDKVDDIQDNAVLKAKQAFLAEHSMAILHFHDHLHAMHPDGVARGMIAQLGWESHVASPDNIKQLHFDGLPLASFAQQIATRLNAQTLRVVGDPDLPVHSVETSWGYCGREGGIKILSDPAVEVLICGETREWELVEYVQDAITAGQQKALIVVGHVLSEQGGMVFATGWLKGFVPEVPVKLVPASEPWWLPAHPMKLS
jgi:putative NIF3 family GTP cyclohydrolase 1 type 2